MTGTTRMTAETTGTTRIIQGGGRRRAEQLALLSIAMVAGVLGFLFVVFWGIALILMGILWGMMAMERQRLTVPDKGVLAEVVDVVVDVAKDVASTGSRHDGSPDTPRERPIDDRPERSSGWQSAGPSHGSDLPGGPLSTGGS